MTTGQKGQNCEFGHQVNTLHSLIKMTGSDHVAKVKTGIINLKGKETVIPSKATKARKRYVNIVDINGVMLTVNYSR
jgi:hypothetical protein